MRRTSHSRLVIEIPERQKARNRDVRSKAKVQELQGPRMENPVAITVLKNFSQVLSAQCEMKHTWQVNEDGSTLRIQRKNMFDPKCQS